MNVQKYPTGSGDILKNVKVINPVARPSVPNVITSYSIHYTKLYEVGIISMIYSHNMAFALMKIGRQSPLLLFLERHDVRLAVTVISPVPE